MEPPAPALSYVCTDCKGEPPDFIVLLFVAPKGLGVSLVTFEMRLPNGTLIGCMTLKFGTPAADARELL